LEDVILSTEHCARLATEAQQIEDRQPPDHHGAVVNHEDSDLVGSSGQAAFAALATAHGIRYKRTVGRIGHDFLIGDCLVEIKTTERWHDERQCLNAKRSNFERHRADLYVGGAMLRPYCAFRVFGWATRAAMEGAPLQRWRPAYPEMRALPIADPGCQDLAKLWAELRSRL